MATFENLRCTQSGLPLGTLDTRLASDVAVRRKEPGRNKRAAFNWTNYLGDTS
ncbi:MAG TPA: hypothetical protein VFW00_15155 [Rhodocyclaceae bacterium]|nr:hypothetical protein [Rhodocyclaceae bacterium]